MTKQRFYYDLARQALALQDTTNDEYNQRAHRSITLAITMVGAGAVIVNLGGGIPGWSAPLVGSLVPLVACFLFVVVASVKAMWFEDWHAGVKPEEVRGHLPTYDEDGLTEWAGDRYAESHVANRGILATRSRYLQGALIGLALEAACLIAFGVTVALSAPPTASQCRAC